MTVSVCDAKLQGEAMALVEHDMLFCRAVC